MPEVPVSRRSTITRLLAAHAVHILVTVGLFLIYLEWLTELSMSEWVHLAVALPVSLVLAPLIPLAVEFRRIRPVLHYAEQAEAGSASHALLRQAFAAVMRHPAVFAIGCALSLFGVMVALALIMGLLGHYSWLHGSRFVLVSVFVIGAAFISLPLAYALAARAVSPIREQTAAALLDPVERGELAPSFPLSRKIQIAVAGTAAGAIVFTTGVSRIAEQDTFIASAARWHQAAFDRLEPALSSGSLRDAIDKALPERSLWPHWVVFEVVDEAQLRAANSLLDPETAESIFGLGAARWGTGRDLEHETVVSWRRLQDGRAVVAVVPSATLDAPFAGQHAVMLVLLVLGLGMSLWVATLLANDVKRALKTLCQEAERVAGGDLRPRPLSESDDELGDLARGFERMRQALREIVERVSSAADAVDATTGELSSALPTVVDASQEQRDRMLEANRLMELISEQVGGVAGSAAALGESVEESSSSILELGAAGDELNGTARLLSGRVDEVSTSIEQMVRSVRQVAESTVGLSDAATDTSSSMEEMASAMLAVNTTVTKTGQLGEAVVESAELGQRRVRQTIEGMHAIREATDTAESVIRGLGEKAEEIGTILDVIEDVGDETSLLALNAAIIAAQSGEHGRAFSVVAEEIKDLAERVLLSTKEIALVIRSVQTEVANAVGAVASGAASVATGVELSAEAGLSLEEITRASRESGDRVSQIVSAVRDQTGAATHVVELMSLVRNGVDEIRAAGIDQERGNEIVFRSSLAMREVAEQVQRTTEEQVYGFGRIREAVENVRESVEQINMSLQEQSDACSQVAQYLEQTGDSARSLDDPTRRMKESTRALRAQADALREDVGRFRI